jgi:hypothetical protein
MSDRENKYLLTTRDTVEKSNELLKQRSQELEEQNEAGELLLKRNAAVN